jgi:MYXO-CTERM domain-containing protein
VAMQSGAPYGDDDSNIYGVRVSPSGAVLDPAPFPISGSDTNESMPAIAFDGANHVVTWIDRYDNVFELHGARVTPGGAVLDPAGILLAPNAHAPAIAFDGTSSVVAYFDEGVRVVRLSPAGAVLDPAGIAVSPGWTGYGASAPAIAFDGVNTTVAWPIGDGVNNYSLYAARVTPQGDVLDPAGILVASEMDDFLYIDDVTAGFDGTNTLIAWNYKTYSDEVFVPHSLVGARFSPDGVALDPSGILFTQFSGSSAAVAFGDGNALVAWTEANDGANIAAARVSSQGAVLDSPGIAVSKSANEQMSPAVTFDGANYLVVWADRRSYGDNLGYDDIYGVRVTPAGVVLDPAGIVIGAGQQWQVSPQAVFDGTNTLVVWQDYLDVPSKGELHARVRGARVTPEGLVLDPTPIQLPLQPAHIEPLGAASDGTNVLVAGMNGSGIEAVLVGKDGTTSGAILVSQSGFNSAVAFGGSSYLVVWDDSGAVRGARLSQDGVSLDPGGFPVSPAGAVASDPAVGFDGVNHFVVWEGRDDPSSGPINVYGARVNQAGVRLDPQGILLGENTNEIPITNAPCDLTVTQTCPAVGTSPAVTFNGQRWIVAWRARATPDLASSTDLHGVEVDSQGEIVSRFTISAEPEIEGPPALGSSGDQQALVAYARLRAETPFNAWRVQARLIGLDVCDDCMADEPLTYEPADGCEDASCDPSTSSDADGQGSPLDPAAGGGCGCRVAGPEPTTAPWLALTLGWLLAVRRTARRRRPRCLAPRW